MAKDLNSETVALQSAGSERYHEHWFLTLWPLAVLFHLAGNDRWLLSLDSEVGWLQIPMMLFASLLLVRRTSGWAAATAISHVLVVIVKLPQVGNHEVFLLLIHLSVLGSLLIRRGQWLTVVIAPLRWILLIGYGAIAFSKLNSAFLDPAVSCAAVFGDEFGRWIGVMISESRMLTAVAIGLTLAVELSIPALLMIRRLRRYGIVLGLWFHTILALEPFGHVFDFTSVLFVLFLSFLSRSVAGEVSEGIEAIRLRLGTDRLVALIVLMVVGNILTDVLLDRGFPTPGWLFDYPIFVVYAGLILQFLPPMIFTGHSERLSFSLHPVLGLVITLTILNALAPYTELRTAGAFNMYSNLAVSDGASNHLVLGDSVIGRRQEMFVVVSTPAESELSFYIENRLLIPRNNLVAYANENPGDETLVREMGDETNSTRAVGSFVQQQSILERFTHRLLLRRAIQIDTPESCLRFWGPAN